MKEGKTPPPLTTKQSKYMFGYVYPISVTIGEQRVMLTYIIACPYDLVLIHVLPQNLFHQRFCLPMWQNVGNTNAVILKQRKNKVIVRNINIYGLNCKLVPYIFTMKFIPAWILIDPFIHIRMIVPHRKGMVSIGLQSVLPFICPCHPDAACQAIFPIL